MKLTACWIVKNEEKVLARSISSVKKIVDDMVVVDTGSTDDTVRIAGEQGARVLHFKWIGDFSAAKNFALEQAAHGYVIFLDADEYLEPPLGPPQKKMICDAFEAHPNINVLSIKREDIDTATGMVTTTGINNRILRHDGHMGYKNKIHEEMVKDGGRPRVMELDLVMKHTGYSKEMMEAKMQRNIAMLEGTLQNETETFNGFMNRLYLMREYEARDPEQSFENWRIVVPQTDNWLYGMNRYRDDFYVFGLRAIMLAGKFRSRISRKYVYEKLFILMKDNYKKFSLAPLMDHIYMHMFDMREDRFMEGFDAAMAASEKSPVKDRFFKEEELVKSLYAAAAHAMWKRGETQRAMTYASRALYAKETGDAQAQLLRMILNGLSGKEPVDIAQAVSGIYRHDDWTKQRFLLKQLMRDDMRAIYLFFMKQLIGSGQHTLDEYLYYALLTGGLEQAMGEAQKAFARSQDEKTFKSVGALLFIAAVALDIEPLYRNNPQGLSDYANILEAYFGDAALEEIEPDEYAALRTYYPYIAFLGGSKAAEKYLHVFSADRRACFFVKVDDCMRNGQYRAVYDTDIGGIEKNDWGVYANVILCAILAGEHAAALAELKRFLKLQLGDEVLSLLLLLAERGGDGVQEEARAAYDKYVRVYEEIVDINDLVTTGIVTGQKDKKAERALTNMDGGELAAWIDGEKDAFVVEPQLALLQKAAAVYREQKYLQQYARSLVRLVAHGYHTGENAAELAALFRGLGNDALAEECDRLRG